MQQNGKIRAMFFKDGAFDCIEIKIVGDPNTVVRKARPEDIERFAAEWAAYNRGAETVDVGGTPLTEVPGITAHMAAGYRLKGVRNVEELAALDDAATRSLGMNSIQFRKAAQLLLAAQELEELKAEKVKRGPGRPPKAEVPQGIQ